MNIKQLASLIPDEYRKEILEANIINRAIAQISDPSMQYLCVVWKNYIELDFTPDCPLCMSRVLKNFKAMAPTLIQLQKDKNLLDSI